MSISNSIIKSIGVLVDKAERDSGSRYFDIVEEISRCFPAELVEQLKQLVNGPVWDGDIISKQDRGILFEMGIAIRVCCKGEQGFTGSKYVGYSILRCISEKEENKQEVQAEQ